MKSAYELAMERLEKSAPAVKISEKQKRELADLDTLYKSKVAEREVFLQGEIAKSDGQPEQRELLRKQLRSELARLAEELEEKKSRVRGK